MTPRDRAAESHRSSKHPRLPLGLAWQPGLRPPCCLRLPWRHLTQSPWTRDAGLDAFIAGRSGGDSQATGSGSVAGEARVGRGCWMGPCRAPGRQHGGPVRGARSPGPGPGGPAASGRRGVRKARVGNGAPWGAAAGPRRGHRTAEREPSLGLRAAAPRGTGARCRGQGRGSSVGLPGRGP